MLWLGVTLHKYMCVRTHKQNMSCFFGGEKPSFKTSLIYAYIFMLHIVYKWKNQFICIKDRSMFSMNAAALLTLSFIVENDYLHETENNVLKKVQH